METMTKLPKQAVAINTKQHKTLITADSMLIEWADEIPYYIYNNDELIIADNELNRILTFDMADNLRIKSIYNF